MNEKHAIKCFADGWKNRRLSTIITARNYDSLKDAVLAAIDEETSSPSTSGDIMSMYRPKNQYNFRNCRGRAKCVRTRSTSYITGRGPKARTAIIMASRPVRGADAYQRRPPSARRPHRTTGAEVGHISAAQKTQRNAYTYAR